MGEAQGVIDGDPVAIIIFVYMVFILILWLSQANSFNPIGQNFTYISSYAQVYTNTKWFLALFAPLGGYIIFNGLENKLKEQGEEEEEE